MNDPMFDIKIATLKNTLAREIDLLTSEARLGNFDKAMTSLTTISGNLDTLKRHLTEAKRTAAITTVAGKK